MGARWQRLEAAAVVLEREIGNASQELRFIRTLSDDSTGGGPSTAAAPVRVQPPAPRNRAAPAPPAPSVPAPYGGFTVARYNSTVAGLKARRVPLQWGTLGLGALISATLVALAVLAKEPMPVWWLAALPAVWMVPVPFFVLSFFGTHRVLRRNHLEITGGV
jgi:hypothetical protein